MRAAPSPPSRTNAEMNATPMLDVLLVLLVIFMLLAMRERRTIDAQLPVPCEGAACDAPPDLPLVLEVLPGPAYRLNGEPVPRAALGARLAAVFASRPTSVLHVAGHAGTSYQQVIAAMDAAMGAGVRVIALAPRQLARVP